MLNKIPLKFALKSEIIALKKILASLSEIDDIKKIILFGSRVRGDFDGSSDMDIMIVTANIKLKNKIIKILHNIELEYDIPISPVIFTTKEYTINSRLKSSFIDNIKKEGIILYGSKD